MNSAQFKDPLCYPCLAWAVIASWSVTQEVKDLIHIPAVLKMFIIIIVSAKLSMEYNVLYGIKARANK